MSAYAGTMSEHVWDEEEMERRAGEAASVLYGGTMDWNSMMGWGQAQKEAGYSEEQVCFYTTVFAFWHGVMSG